LWELLRVWVRIRVSARVGVTDWARFGVRVRVRLVLELGLGLELGFRIRG
jgi:hypothetical protein